MNPWNSINWFYLNFCPFVETIVILYICCELCLAYLWILNSISIELFKSVTQMHSHLWIEWFHSYSSNRLHTSRHDSVHYTLQSSIHRITPLFTDQSDFESKERIWPKHHSITRHLVTKSHFRVSSNPYCIGFSHCSDPTTIAYSHSYAYLWFDQFWFNRTVIWTFH